MTIIVRTDAYVRFNLISFLNASGQILNSEHISILYYDGEILNVKMKILNVKMTFILKLPWKQPINGYKLCRDHNFAI